MANLSVKVLTNYPKIFPIARLFQSYNICEKSKSQMLRCFLGYKSTNYLRHSWFVNEDARHHRCSTSILAHNVNRNYKNCTTENVDKNIGVAGDDDCVTQVHMSDREFKPSKLLNFSRCDYNSECKTSYFTKSHCWLSSSIKPLLSGIRTNKFGENWNVSLKLYLDINYADNRLGNRNEIGNGIFSAVRPKFTFIGQTLCSLSSVEMNILQQKFFMTGRRYFHVSSAELQHDTTSSDMVMDKKDASEKKKFNFSQYFTGKNAWKAGAVSVVLMLFSFGGNLLLLWGPPLLDDEGLPIEDEFFGLPTWEEYFKRTIKNCKIFIKDIQEPSSSRLLPDPVKPPYYQPPYTLVIELTDILVHPDWTLQTGWRFKKRPGVEYFLQKIGPPLYEIVVYTKENGMTAFPIVNGIDPNGMISYRLFRDDTKYMNGYHVKDLGALNRNLDKVIFIDCDPKAFQLHPENGLLLKKWKGNDEDRTLADLANLLQMIASSGVSDVRDVLQHYSQYDDPVEAFKENQKKLTVTTPDSKLAQHKSPLDSLAVGFGGRGR